jgi:antitoxin HicB
MDLAKSASAPTMPSMAGSTAHEVERFLDLPYHIVLMRDEEGGDGAPWRARVEELPGCEAREETSEEAARAIEKAMEDWIATTLEKGGEVPEPKRQASHSGRLLLRIPQTLHAELAHRAESEETSLNGYITSVLAGTVGWQRNGDPHAGGSGAGEKVGGSRSRVLSVAIVANIVAVVIAAIAAIVLLVVAWQQGW